MPDETNLTEMQESADESGLDDLTYDETGSESGEGQEEGLDFEDGSEEGADKSTEEQTSSEGEGADSQHFTVKYNGKEVQMTQNELIVNAQKGMNYDHVKSELESLKSSPEIQRLLSTQGKSIPSAGDTNAPGELGRLMREYPGNERLAREVYELRQRDRAYQQAEATNNAHRERMEQWTQIFKESPEMREIGNLPEEVKAAALKGESVIAAFRAWENKELKNKMKMLEQNARSREKSPGSVRGDAKSKGEDDPFLQGFFEG